ncbi:hypothetical protein CA13_44090 [Planctomycetes bacterium CA13]|uniref:DUF58 domain-containing protein n=1 Tax=Novipirellula herctigrandis TaxID=2527986 RepID=A0A5C5Z7B7_9BACT|nr:hypothetical protein CA13_44090 [Planctomycetes bacterium CA13]
MTNRPNDRDFLDPQVVSRLRGLPLVARKLMLGSVSGRHSSPHRGASVEFAEYRKYVPGDDLRRLDWRAYGRSDRFFVKEFEADTNLRLVFVLDTSASMAFGSGPLSKLDYAKRIVATLGYLAIEQGDAVGLFCVADQIKGSLPASRNASHLSVLFDTLEQTQGEGETRLADVLHELAETVRQRAWIVVLSDFFSDPESLRDCFEHLRFRNHDVSAFHLMDPEEICLPIERPTRFVDMESGATLFAEPAEIADRYDREVRDYLESIKRVALETEVDYQFVSLDMAYEKVLTQFLLGRIQGRGGR